MHGDRVINRTLKRSARKSSKQLAPVGGRPTNGTFPCWNFNAGGKGLLVGLGWPGQWSAKFDRDEAKGAAAPRRSGTDAFQAAAGRGSADAAGRAAILSKAIGFAVKTSGGAGCSRTMCRGPAESRLRRCRPSARAILTPASSRTPPKNCISSGAMSRKRSCPTTGGRTPAGIPAVSRATGASPARGKSSPSAGRKASAR